jgi:hypothetical protein
MTGFEWFLILLLVVGGVYLLGHRSTQPVPSSQPRGQMDDANQDLGDPNAQQPRRHGGCC